MTDPDPIAEPRDVRRRINLDDPEQFDEVDVSGISDADIRMFLEDASFDLSQATDIDAMEDGLRRQLEWRMAALEILTIRKGSRAYHQQSLGSMSRSYEARITNELREWCETHGPDGLFDDTDEFWSASIQG